MTTKKSTKKTTKKAVKKATKKAAKKSAKKPSKKTGKKSAGKAATKTARKSAPRGRAGGSKAGKSSPAKGGGGGGKVKGLLRVRMYRVGFGDFFLLTVPTANGPQHILIDCGVHAGNIGTINDCVDDLAKETDRKLALVIATHAHADHLSGFASNFDKFAEFEVGAVWMSNRLDPDNKEAARFHAQIKSLADQLRLRLGARDDLEGKQALWKVEDALGVQGLGAAEGSNDKALRLLRTGFKNKPPVYYYEAGQDPVLPDELKGAITAELLGPAPKDSGGIYADSDNASMQYLAAASTKGLPSDDPFMPFERDWQASALDYPEEAFDGYQVDDQPKIKRSTPAALEYVLHASQPDVMLAMADKIDGTLNNQSLVILFTCQDKRLLFVGDAQWGNWSYWLYGKRMMEGKEKAPGINESAKEILGSIDFYKVGHHGSTNANPIPAVTAMNPDCASMCSTESSDAYPKKKRPYGKIESGTEVPRTKLMDALEEHTNFKLVRSDWIPVQDVLPSPEAQKQLPRLPDNFSKGDLYVDYIFPN